ncbi:MAG: queuine tRNA-ribosyltransferase [Dehalococcoidia bacterium]|nr:MAG: queuine tRNA-ribosyltransferase [Dehalococcoidia bacterium]
MVPAPWGAVRGLLPEELRASGVTGLVVGSVELALRPGLATVEALGGLGALTDGLAVIGEPGIGALLGEGGLPPARIGRAGETIAYRNGLDGAEGELTPESSLAAQQRLGVAIAIAPTLPEHLTVNERPRAIPVTLAETWLRRGAAVRSAARVLALIPAGSPRFQRRLLEVAAESGFDGVAVATLVPRKGWPAGWIWLALTVSTVDDVRTAVALGYDYVVPSFALTLARRGEALAGTSAVAVAGFPAETGPLDLACDCPACRFPLGYLAHLVRANEMLGETLLLLHNLRVLTRIADAA